MREAIVKYNNIKAGILTEENSGKYVFVYDEMYVQTYPKQFSTFKLPVTTRSYRGKRLFPFFDGPIT
ncbi:HipA N-terminal domain-containing protein [Cytophagaceae bacterium YF14B1]|uniref:HipA N-terminal domain-containing protein n=1 Tax=Xanthocytophaga flava TaxID=3048013 RepID=A0AAE3UCM3_9BACT|nr:HipA N-terminal domain-containing protein [Xanthocytophaga flavus]MDJ1485628.1 HipA N-terminal domain-containing protein [Xanthocytophaga flavus]